MRLIRYEQNGQLGLAAELSGAFHGLLVGDAAFPGDVDQLLAQGANLSQVGKMLGETAPVVELSQVKFRPPVGRAGKIVCLGLNYADHVLEFGRKIPERPEIFSRFNSTLVGHESPLLRPFLSEQFDYEGELAVIIGRAGRHIPHNKALDHVAAYSIFNDASVRDYQNFGSQWLPGKNFDSSGAFGPWLVTPDALPQGAAGLNIQTRVNGQILQKSNTADFIRSVADIISYLSQIMTLEPGDVLSTGTPGGVGYARQPQIFLKAGDVCEVEIEGLGILRNPVVDEKRAG